MNHKYAPMYRPPSFCTVPKGWTLVERPAFGLGFDKRTDLPASSNRFGVIAYEQPLTDDDLKRYELRPV